MSTRQGCERVRRRGPRSARFILSSQARIAGADLRLPASSAAFPRAYLQFEPRPTNTTLPLTKPANASTYSDDAGQSAEPAGDRRQRICGLDRLPQGSSARVERNLNLAIRQAVVITLGAYSSLGGQGKSLGSVRPSGRDGGYGGQNELTARIASSCQVDWRAGDVFDRRALDSVMPNSTAVVSTLGILLESDYKSQGSVSPLGVLRGIVDHALGSKGNPLNPKRKTYEKYNRDAGKSLSCHYYAPSLQPTPSPPLTPLRLRNPITPPTPPIRPDPPCSPRRIPGIRRVALDLHRRRELAVRVPLGGGRVPAVCAGAVH